VNTATSAGLHVHGFLALKNKADAVGGNIVSVWFQRPAVPGQPWPSKAWQSTDQWDAIKTIAADLNLPTDEWLGPTTDPKTLDAPPPALPPGASDPEYGPPVNHP